MKKIFYLFALTVLCACNSNSEKKAGTDADSTTVDTTSTAPANYSLNGIPEKEAREMIAAFRKDSTSSSPQTSIWFSTRFLDAVLETAQTATAVPDGIRIHMAKNSNNENTVVVLLTTDVGKLPRDTTRRIHREFFSPHSTLLSSADVRNVDNQDRPTGATMYVSGMCLSSCTDRANYVDCPTAYKWVENYRLGHQASKLINTRSVWYSIELIKKLREELQAGKGDKSDGIRLYFMKNDNGRHGFLLVPTTEITGGHQDNYKCYLNLKSNKGGYDRGEECTPFCDEVIVP